jgi:hypothetical protein
MDSPANSRLVLLPDEVLKLILQHVPVKDRLSSCCLVSRRMHAAAVAATESLSIGMSPGQIPPYRTEQVLQMLSHCGHHLTALELCEPHGDWSLRQLPCPNLLELTLTSGSVQLGAADGYPGVVQGCTKLTRLELRWNNMGLPEGAVLDSLSRLVHLHHLVMMPHRRDGYKWRGLSETTLPSLQHLTHLELNCWSTKNLLQLRDLTKLQVLLLAAVYINKWGAAENTAVGPSSVPGLLFPASLTTLSLSLPVEAGILSLAPVGLQRLCIYGTVQGPSQGPDSFLSCMARLQHLTELALHPENEPDWPPAGPAYSALTASSRLVQLTICDTSCPQGVWPYVFPTSRKLPHLTALELRPVNNDCADLPSWSAADLRNLVSCCPSLCAAGALSLQHGPCVSELHKLTALTRLRLYYCQDDPDSFEGSMRSLAAVTRLRDLEVLHHTADVIVASLLPLTSLTALTKLRAQFDSAFEHGVHISLSTKMQVSQSSMDPLHAQGLWHLFPVGLMMVTLAMLVTAGLQGCTAASDTLAAARMTCC